MLFTIDAMSSASLPAMDPAAVTAAVVSMLPPIHAPVTTCESPSCVASQGCMKIDGSAKRMTRPVVYARSSFFAWTAPAAAMAALTPQIASAAASRARSFASSPRAPARNQVNRNTDVTTMSACATDEPRYFMMSDRLTDAPRRTRPVLMKNSVRNAAFTRSRTPRATRTAPPSRPTTIA